MNDEVNEEVVEATEEPSGPTPDQIQQAHEDKAKRSGWAPKAEFKGAPDQWRDAGEWNERADTVLPIMKATNKKLEEELSRLGKENTETKDTLKRITKVNDEYLTGQYDSQMADINTQMETAVEIGDTEAFTRLREQEANIVKPEPITVPENKEEPAVQEPSTETVRWMNDNPWFGKEENASNLAKLVAGQLPENDPLRQPGNEYALGEYAKRQAQAIYPNVFTNPNQEISDMDEPTIRGTETVTAIKNGKTWNDLPQDAKDHCNKLLKNPRLVAAGFTKEKYMATYNEGDNE